MRVTITTKGEPYMNYLSIYNSLIEKRLLIPVPNIEYSEQHHIKPKCLGGDDSKENLVRLTAREHFMAHCLLYKHYRTSKLAHAWYSMLRCDKNQKRFFTAREHESAKKAHIEALRISMKGDKNPFYGKTHTDETKKSISEKITQWHQDRETPKEQIESWVERVAKLPASEKQKQVVGALSKNKITLKNIHTGECKRIDKSEAVLYNLDIWKHPGVVTPQRRDSCVHCGMESVAGNIARWHNDNCKHKDKLLNL